MAARGTDPATDQAVLWGVVIVVGALVLWAAIANVLGGPVGFAVASLVATAAACVTWRDKLTFELLSNLAVFGVPVLVVGLSLS